MNDRIYLIGPRGSGKTTVGRLLAERRGCPFIDLDRAIEAATGKTIAEIFAEQGELHFRQLESEQLKLASELPGVGVGVIATGGGIVLARGNCALMQATGKVFWLTAPAVVLWNRIQADESTASSRPALTNLAGLAEMLTIVAARETLYRATADADIDTEDASPDDVVELIELALADF